MSTPRASITSFTESVTSGPVPSPGIRVTVCATKTPLPSLFAPSYPFPLEPTQYNGSRKRSANVESSQQADAQKAIFDHTEAAVSFCQSAPASFRIFEIYLLDLP